MLPAGTAPVRDEIRAEEVAGVFRTAAFGSTTAVVASLVMVVIMTSLGFVGRAAATAWVWGSRSFAG